MKFRISGEIIADGPVGLMVVGASNGATIKEEWVTPGEYILEFEMESESTVDLFATCGQTCIRKAGILPIVVPEINLPTGNCINIWK